MFVNSLEFSGRFFKLLKAERRDCCWRRVEIQNKRVLHFVNKTYSTANDDKLQLKSI